jgi:hypothetical protein
MQELACMWSIRQRGTFSKRWSRDALLREQEKQKREEFELKILCLLKIDDREQICAQDMELTSIKYNEGKTSMT